MEKLVNYRKMKQEIGEYCKAILHFETNVSLPLIT